jgi:heme exporter protein B
MAKPGSQLLFLIQHALRVEMRNKHGIAGLLVFAVASVYTCYQATGAHAEKESWNALAWVVLLFAAFNAVSKPWADDQPSMQSFLMHTVHPKQWMLARITYYSMLLALVSTVTYGAFLLFLGMDHLTGWKALHYYLGVLMTSTALATLLAMIQALASRAGGGFNLIAVLGLPLIIPVILVSTRYGNDLMRGIAFGDTAHHLLFLATLSAGFTALGYILFPYLWRD